MAGKQLKICGLRRKEDITIINEYEPDYVGFIFAPSKRQITIAEAKELIPHLNENIEAVGVFVNQPIPFVIEAVKTGLKGIQLHGKEDLDYVLALRRALNKNNLNHLFIWKAFQIKDETTIATISDELLEAVDGILFDTYNPANYGGGTGESFNWHLLDGYKSKSPGKKIILAGGLKAENIEVAMQLQNADCFDLSSSIEGSHGFKDKCKIHILINTFKQKN